MYILPWVKSICLAKEILKYCQKNVIWNLAWGIAFNVLRSGITWSSFRSTNSLPQSSSLIWTISSHAFTTLGMSANECRHRLVFAFNVNYMTVWSYSHKNLYLHCSLNCVEYSHMVLKLYLSQMQIVCNNVTCPCMGRNFFVNSPMIISRVRGCGIVGHNIDRHIIHVCVH